MFEPELISHDKAVARAIDAVGSTSRDRVASAFLASLTSRRLDLRSALGSYAMGLHLTQHSFRGSGVCDYCGEYDESKPRDLSVLNFERLKWGGVRRAHPIYIWLDLKAFEKLQVPSPSDADVQIFRNLLAAAQALSPTARARDLEKSIANCLGSNKAEREVLLQILGYAGLLEAREHPGFSRSYVPVAERSLPPANKIDWHYPFAWWRGADGVNSSAAELWFAKVLHGAA